MEDEIHQIKLELLEHIKVDIESHTQENHILLCEERGNLIRETFKASIHTLIPTKELVRILGSYLKREQETQQKQILL